MESEATTAAGELRKTGATTVSRAQQEEERAEARAAADGVAAAKEEAAEAKKQLEQRIAADLAGDAEAVQLQAKLKVLHSCSSHACTLKKRDGVLPDRFSCTWACSAACLQFDSLGRAKCAFASSLIAFRCD